MRLVVGVCPLPPSPTSMQQARMALRMASHDSHPSPTYGRPHSSLTLPCTRALNTSGLALLAPSHAIEPSVRVSSTPRPSFTLHSLLCTQTWGMLGREGGGGEERLPTLPYARPCPCPCLTLAPLFLLLLLLLKRTRMRVECASIECCAIRCDVHT